MNVSQSLCVYLRQMALQVSLLNVMKENWLGLIKKKFPELPTWEGDRVFLNLLLSGEERFFSIKLKYEGKETYGKNRSICIKIQV